MNRISIILALIVLSVACSKDKDSSTTEPQNPAQATSLGQLSISPDFNWSAGIKQEVKLNINTPSYLSSEGQIVEIYHESGELLSRLPIKQGSIDFKLAIPHSEERIFAFYRNTGEFADISVGGEQNLNIATLDLDGDLTPRELPSFISEGMNKKSTTGPNLMTNGDFEGGAISLSDSRTTSAMRTPGDWYTRMGTPHLQAVNGSTVFSTNASTPAQIIQTVAVEPFHKYEIKADAVGASSFRVYLFDGQQNLLGYILPKKQNDKYELTYTLTKDVKFVQIYCQAEQGTAMDNISVAKVIEPDSDNDGVIDRLDDYPNDANKAIANFYPLKGRQTLAFEDLWPALGDYDFNDMVLSNLVEYGGDVNGNLVDARFKIQINAIGAGVSSGIGIKLYKPDGSPLTQNVIAGFSGEGQLDPDVSNGIILFDKARDGLNGYYTNTTNDSRGDQIEYEFTITFNQNMTEVYAFPDIYIFRSADRGREIHLPGMPPTEAADPTYFNTVDDVNGTYRSEKGLPWAIELLAPANNHFKHPLEKVDICAAYPYFQTWAESKGKRYSGWMIWPNANTVFSN